MPPTHFNYVYKNGNFWVHDNTHTLPDARLIYPRDSQEQAATPVMGFNYDTGELVPVSVDAAGSMTVSATFSGAITIADVTITDKLSALDLSILAPSAAAALGTGGFMPLGKTVHPTAPLMMPFLLNNLGAISTDNSIMQMQNMKSAFTYRLAGPALGEIDYILEHLAGAIAGDPAKKSQFNYDGTGNLIDVTVTDVTL